MIDHRITPEEEGERADLVVARHAGVARSRAQAALKDGKVTVDGRTVRPSHRVATGEVLEGRAEVAARGGPQAEDIPIDIRYSDERVLVVSKPAGLVTHPAGGHLSGTLVNALLGLGGALSGMEGERPGIVHRLDKDTSGLLLVARDDEAHAYLTGAMKERRVGRTYLALVRGPVSEDRGTVDAPVGRHPVKRHRMSVAAGGRAAVTHYEVLDRAEGVTFLRVRLETGRTHQIRVHMAHLRHPVLGDKTYGGGSEPAGRLGLTRPFLHAWKLDFPHPDDGRRIEVVDPLPDELAGVLEAAGLEPPPQG